MLHAVSRSKIPKTFPLQFCFKVVFTNQIMLPLSQIGLGTIWEVRQLIDSATAPCAYSATSAASAEYQSISGCSGINAPIDQFGCAHWEETCFVDELMSTSLGVADANNDIAFQLSRISLGALEDLGYLVDYSAADPYTSADMSQSCTCLGRNTPDLPDGLPSGPSMSEELRAKATAFGKQVLREKHNRRQRRLKSKPRYLKRKKQKDYVGDRVVSLVLREHGRLFSMVVTESYD
jgi:hypothetical protein